MKKDKYFLLKGCFLCKYFLGDYILFKFTGVILTCKLGKEIEEIFKRKKNEKIKELRGRIYQGRLHRTWSVGEN